MKKTLLFLVIVFSLKFSVCSAAYYTFKLVGPAENYDMKYDTENAYFSFALAKKNPDRLLVSIYNKTDGIITVDWGKTSLIFGQKAYNVLPGSQFSPDSNIYSGLNPASIPPHTLVEESLFAEGSITVINSAPIVTGGFGFGYFPRPWGGWLGFDDFYRIPGYSGWKVRPFFSAADEEAANNSVGYKFALFLPVIAKDAQTNYRFDFEIVRASEETSPGVLGLSLTDRRERAIWGEAARPAKGVEVVGLSRKGAAKKAGLLPGDNIIKIDGLAIDNTDEFVFYVNKKAAGESITITYLRGGAEYAATAKLGKA
ncbi:MAG: PDZ domain-containing protein [Acidaminococcales bacterium]|nr:PDZ domain-containing protein [Acidaminococcales bacterium]